ncbi:hypothetical protein WA026_023417 [Henosepilachna vigintioctopunctata]|uniref:Retrotransposon gag domain-containing protein n=1 Tax=Henosepilachna vigintioctopunctata TaxID=420089 RepID=A0AAW1TZU8_9CUCU
MVRIEISLTCDSVKKGAPQIKVKTIKRFGENKVYMFSNQHQNAEEHKSLLNIPSVRRAVEVISNRGDYRDVVATLPEDIVGLYFDEEENFVFQDYLLAECNKTATTNENKTMKSEELDIFSKVKHFVLDKYNGSQNAEEWINIFEKECDRLRVDLDVSKIQILRLFLEENAVEWYKATLSKFSINGTWNQWSQHFLDTYAGKNWSQVFYAFNYRYISGSLLDYALKKERLLLETDAKMTENTRINLIVCGLPSYVYNKFNIKEVSSSVKLMNILGTYNNISKKNQSNLRMKLSSFQEKKPCTVCEKLGFSGRFHPVEMCWNKDKKKVNFTGNTSSKNSEEHH